MPRLALAACLIVVAAAPAADPLKVGQTVMPMKPGLALEVQTTKAGRVKTVATEAVYVVREVKDGELLLFNRSQMAWGKAEDWLSLDDALTRYTQFHEAFPKNLWALNYRGVARREKGDLDGAQRDFEELVKLQPKNPTMHAGVASLYARKGQHDKAIGSLDEAIRLDPQYADAYLLRARAWMAKKDYDRAIGDFDTAIRIEPIHFTMYNERAMAWYRKGQIDKAVDDCTEAIKQDVTQPVPVYNRSRLWAYKGEYQKALADLDQALRLAPKYAHALAGKARLLAVCPDGKIRDGKKAVELGVLACELSKGKSGEDLDALASAYAEAGDFDKAVATQKKALEDRAFAVTFGQDARARLELYGRKEPFRAAPNHWPSILVGPKP